ncbi:hypothetical protein G210_2430 [Candida maltosa Xu316]|uniref:Zn(2)-C6 fungal-type domain-containing protein n=1 Tax=Candida maltosa (strain Xu316) TaxID=1245528 RepID=M3J5D1_CANMX|nr:hypothetical protein G210_2430 [Candida maltosa Xu316]
MSESKKIRRSRTGCHNCKRMKIKCDEKKPTCSYCIKTKANCDYSIKLTWGGRPYKNKDKRKTNGMDKSSTMTRDISTSVSSTITNEPEKPQNSNNNNNNNDGFQFVFHQFREITPNVPSPSSESIFSHHSESSPTQPIKKRKVLSGNQTNGSPQTFQTPNGNSILDMGPVFSQDRTIPQILVDGSNDVSPVQVPNPVTDIMPEINNGINSLTNALADIGYESFQLQNSNIFNDFLQHSEKHQDYTKPDSTSDESEKLYLSNYTQDLNKIEQYLPRRESNMFADKLPMRSMSNMLISETPKIVNLDPEEENEVAPLDLDMELFWQSIPPSLSPLPEMLLNVPFYRNLMHFWVNVASHHLVPAPSGIYRDNPFKILLTQMAMEYPSIMSTLLAFSAKMRSTLIGSDDTPDVIIDQLLSRSCSELLILLKNNESATSNEALATALLLSCFEVFNSKDFSRHRAHNIGARQIIKARSGSPISKGPESGTESDITFFLTRWFVYTDVIGALSAATNSHNYLLAAGDSSKYEPLESIIMYHDINDDTETEISKSNMKNIDYLMGFDIRFLAQFTKITTLIRQTNAYLQQAGSDPNTLPMDIIKNALEVKESLIMTSERDELFFQQNHKEMVQKINQLQGASSPGELNQLVEENDILRYTNKIFCNAGLIHLYRRVLLIPRSSTLVQDLVNTICDLAKYKIESKSPADICSIFCIFTAGCEVLDPERQHFFHQRFENLAEMGNINARKGLVIMKRCWETGESWIDAAKSVNVDITLL